MTVTPHYLGETYVMTLSRLKDRQQEAEHESLYLTLFCSYCMHIKVRCGWLLVAMYLRPLLYAKIIFQISEFYDKEFKRYSLFYMSLLPSTM